MRFPLLLLSFLLVGQLTAKRILFHALIDQPTESNFFLGIRPSADADPNSFRIDLRTPNESWFEMEVPVAQLITLNYGNENIQFHVDPATDTPEFRFTAGQLRQTIQFSGINAEKNNVLTGFFRQLGGGNLEGFRKGYITFEIPTAITQQIKSMTPNQFFGAIRQKEVQLEQYLNGQRGKINSELFNFLKHQATYDLATQRLAYFLLNQTTLGGQLSAYQQQFNPIAGVTVNNNSAFEHEAYLNFLRAYVQYLYLPNNDYDERLVAKNMYNIVDQQLQGQAKAYLQAQLLIKYYDISGNPKFGSERFDQFKSSNAYPKWQREVEAAYGAVLTLSDNYVAPDIIMTTANGRPVQLSDYRGKLVYISFWASWCKPCLANFKKSVELRQELQNIGVTLLNISIDDSPEPFHATLAAQPIIGENLLVMDKDATQRDYNLYSIPAYFIVDRQGKFTYLSEDSSRNILEEFRELVRK